MLLFHPMKVVFSILFELLSAHCDALPKMLLIPKDSKTNKIILIFSLFFLELFSQLFSISFKSSFLRKTPLRLWSILYQIQIFYTANREMGNHGLMKDIY